MISVFGDAKIAGVTLKNRIFRSATHEGMADKNGCTTEMLLKKYELLARGEVGAIITGYAAIQQDGKCSVYNSLMIDSDSQIRSFHELTHRVHEQGTAIFLQIAHCGRQTRSEMHPIKCSEECLERYKLLKESVKLHKYFNSA
jgi:2,4-dienoyl-CoA reductase-like NADH-dependent reductase (Old Yellow Enzyme family)